MSVLPSHMAIPRSKLLISSTQQRILTHTSNMKSIVLFLAAVVPMVAADNPKLNQYRNMDDWLETLPISTVAEKEATCLHTPHAHSRTDRNILYHAAPPLGQCYSLDSQTGTFFYNRGYAAMAMGEHSS